MWHPLSFTNAMAGNCSANVCVCVYLYAYVLVDIWLTACVRKLTMRALGETDESGGKRRSCAEVEVRKNS